MRFFKFFSRCVSFFAVLSLIFYPVAAVPSIFYTPEPPAPLPIPQKGSIPTYDSIIQMLDELEAGELEEKYSEEDLKKLTDFIAHLAREGALPSEAAAIEEDIQNLLYSQEEESAESFFQYALPSRGKADYVILSAFAYPTYKFLPCRSWAKKQWRHIKKFAKKNKKALIIGTAIVVTAAIVVCAVVAASAAAGAGAAAAGAGAAGAAAASSSDPDFEEAEQEGVSPPPLLYHHQIVEETPYLQAVIEEHLAYAKEESLPQETSSVTGTIGFLAHDAWRGIAQLAAVVPELKAELDRMVAYSEPGLAMHNTSSAAEEYARFIEAGHEKIDQFFSTNTTDYFMQDDDKFVIGILPFPEDFSKGVGITKLKGAIRAQRESVALARELGFTSREIGHLAQAGTLEKTVASTFEAAISDKIKAESLTRFTKAQDFLKPHQGKYLPEIEVRELIHQTGVQTFPRPPGIPENFRVRISNTGAGLLYVHPEHEHTCIRVMPGKPHSSNPCQQKPYVKHMKDGRYYDRMGNIVNKDSTDAHIPFDEFLYIKD